MDFYVLQTKDDLNTNFNTELTSSSSFLMKCVRELYVEIGYKTLHVHEFDFHLPIRHDNSSCIDNFYVEVVVACYRDVNGYVVNAYLHGNEHIEKCTFRLYRPPVLFKYIIFHNISTKNKQKKENYESFIFFCRYIRTKITREKIYYYLFHSQDNIMLHMKEICLETLSLIHDEEKKELIFLNIQ